MVDSCIVYIFILIKRKVEVMVERVSIVFDECDEGARERVCQTLFKRHHQMLGPFGRNEF